MAWRVSGHAGSNGTSRRAAAEERRRLARTTLRGQEPESQGREAPPEGWSAAPVRLPEGGLALTRREAARLILAEFAPYRRYPWTPRVYKRPN